VNKAVILPDNKCDLVNSVNVIADKARRASAIQKHKLH